MSALALPRTAADLAMQAHAAAMAEQDEHRDDIISKLADRLIELEDGARRNRDELHAATAAGWEKEAVTAAKWVRYYSAEFNRIVDCTRYGEEAHELAVRRRALA